MIHHFHIEALREGFEPTTNRLTVYCSTTELTEQFVRTGFYFYRCESIQSTLNYQIIRTDSFITYFELQFAT